MTGLHRTSQQETDVKHAIAGLGALASAALAFSPAAAQSPAEFYKGKTVQFGVGYAPSGGFDAYTRAAARFIGKYIPGNPTVIVQNMPGASSLTYVRYLQTKAPKDGTQFGMFNRGLIPKSVLDPKETGVDFKDFTWIGSMNSEMAVCYTWNARGIASIADLKKAKSVTLGDTSKNSGGYIYTSILRSISPDNTRLILGYANTGDIWLAIERGELDGNCTLYTSLQAQRPEWIAQNKIHIQVQFAEEKHPDLRDVPTIFEITKSDKEKKAINFLIAAETIGRPVIAPPGIPADRAAALRKAFLDTMKDSEFLAFAKQAKMDIEVVEADKAAKIVADIAATPKEALDLARQLME
jgi:tripartite-type tricarboxylate transporter receptor subunit TctC